MSKVSSSSNDLIIKVFLQLIEQINAEYLNAQADNDIKAIQMHKFRLQSMRNIIKIIESLDFDIKKPDDLLEIPGIGKNTIRRVDEILRTGTLQELGPQYGRKRREIIDSIQELQSVIGIGKVTARNMVVKEKIKSVSELKKAITDGRIKVNNSIILGLKYHGVVQGNIPRKEVTMIRKMLEKIASSIDSKMEIMICGSYRRGKPTSGDIDLLIYHPEIKSMDQITNAIEQKLPQYLKLFVEKLEKIGFLLDSLTDKDPQILFMGFCKYKQNPVRRIDIRYIPFISLPTAMLYFTGPFELNAFMRHEAKKRNMILNEYGLFMRDSNKEIRININSEADVFDILGMYYLSPEERNKFDSGRIKFSKNQIK